MSRRRKLTPEQESWVSLIREDRTLREMGALLGVSKSTLLRTLRPTIRHAEKVRRAGIVA